MKVTSPEKILIHRRSRSSDSPLQVPGANLVVIPHHGRPERKTGRQIIEMKILEQTKHRSRKPGYPCEGRNGIGGSGVVILKASGVTFLNILLNTHIPAEGLIERIAETKVGQTQQSVPAVLGHHTDIGQMKTTSAGVFLTQAPQRIPGPCCGPAAHSITEQNILIEGVVFGCNESFPITGIDRNLHPRLLRKEFSQLSLSGHIILTSFLLAAGSKFGVQAPETNSGYRTGKRYCGQIGQTSHHTALGSPAPFVVLSRQPEFIHPHLGRSGLAAGGSGIANPDHHCTDVSQVGISAHKILASVNHMRKGAGEGHRGFALLHCGIPGQFHGNQLIQLNIHPVQGGPYFLRICGTPGGKFQRHLIFVIIAPVVRTNADKQGQLIVFEGGSADAFGMHFHTQPFVIPHVQNHVLVYGPGIPSGKVFDT